MVLVGFGQGLVDLAHLLNDTGGLSLQTDSVGPLKRGILEECQRLCDEPFLFDEGECNGE